MSKKILFVDDQSNLLMGLKRLLRPLRNEWNMEFALGGQEAIKQLQTHDFDILVTDMQMPQVDGAQVLQFAREHSPGTVRIVLSGQASDEKLMKSFACAHQYLSKPCEIETLKARLERAYSLEKYLKKENIRKQVAQLVSLACLPMNYESLEQELSKTSPSLEALVQIISSDIALSAKILQAVNSSFFGSGKEVVTVKEAVLFLGVQTLQAFFHETGIIQPLSNEELLPFFISIHEHSNKVALLAATIAQMEMGDEDERHAVTTAALFHEIGRMILLQLAPELQKEVLTTVSEGRSNLFEAEEQVFGATHSEIGAYLLALWGLPQSIVNAVAFYHSPLSGPHRTFSTLTVLHAANALQSEYERHFDFDPKPSLNQEYVRAVRDKSAPDRWREIQASVTTKLNALSTG
ncbi:MAG: HDOD domain-containing protein [Bdellovibrionales bacterium]|nr:HDOD domain-containing protein [Bdellovibrionales bacterium]